MLVAVVAAVIGTTRQTADLPAYRPEGVVQRYLQAIADGDADTATSLYTPDLQQRCDEQDFGPRPGLFEDRSSFEAELRETEIDGDRARVRVRITEFAGEPPFGGGGYDHDEVFVLERVGADWRLADARWPYYLCPA